MPVDVPSASTRLAPRAAVWPLAPILVLNFAIGVAEIIHPAPIFNDGLLHLHQVERMDLAWERGESIIDHWDETLGLGYPFTRTYAYFSHLTIWGIHRALGDGVALPAIYTFLVSLAWFLWPLSLYRGLLLLEAKPLVAVGASWMASLAHTEFRFGIDLETFGWLGYGFLPNLMALLAMPLALGYGWQFIKNGKAFVPAALAFIFVTGCHLMMGYVVGVTWFLWFAVLYWKHRSRQLPMRFGSLLLATGLALLFLVVPYIRDSPFINRTALEHPHYWDSVGLMSAVRSLLTGRLVDYHVLVPVITLLAGVGAYKAVKGGRWARGVLMVGGFWFLAFAGRGWWNPLTYALPFSASIPFERFLIPLQMCLFVLAGMGLDALCEWTRVKVSSIRIGMFLTLLFCLHLGKNIDQGLLKSMQAKRRVVAAEPEITQVLEQIAHLDQVGNGERLLVTADPQVKIGDVPLYALPLMAHLPHVGFLWHSMSLNAEFLSGVDLDSPAVRDPLAVRYVLQELGAPDTPSSQAIWHNDRFELRFIPQNALFCAGRLSRSLHGTTRENADEIRHWMQSSQPLNGEFLGLNTTIDGPTKRSNQVLGYGRVTEEEFGYDAKIHFAAAGHLIAKVTFHPQWQAWVDGVETAIQPVAPSLMAVPIEPGQHMVQFRYRPSGSTKWLLIFGLVQLVVFAKLSRSKYFRSNAKK